ncbi:MAG TPA: acyl-CoA dehydrogenase family protein [Methylomirabilota bacterium]|nr:acyl-CoA dehydrogenase family protein [Methylomirabilota bacterium]
MDFTLSPAQQLLVATARDFLGKHCPPETAQRLALDTRGFDEGLWRRMAELGWPGLLIPGDLGGSDGTLLDVILLVEEMGRAALPSPFVTSAVVATSLLVAAASVEQRGRLLPAMATGERIATMALVEEDGSFDPTALALRCQAPGRLTGTKLFVRDAHVADDLIVVLGGGDLLLLPADRPGIARLPLDTLSGERTFEVIFDAVEVHAGDQLGAPGRGRGALAAALTAGALARTAEMVGAAQRVLDLAVEHARTRVQGGRPIGGYQAIQHACADLVRDVDASRGLLHVAAWKVSEGLEAGLDVATAKAYAGEACLAVARRAHQIFGAIGYCEEHPLHLLHKRIQAASVDFGDTALHLETVARQIGLR